MESIYYLPRMKQVAFNISQINSTQSTQHDFVQSKSNSQALDLLQNWPQHFCVHPYPGTIIIYGPPASGKTHLAKLWALTTDAYFITNTDIFIDDLVNKYNAFILDDLSSFDEEKTLHWFNMIHEKRKFLLITARSLTTKLPDLSSRILSLASAKIEEPDDELLQIFILKFFSNCSVIISKNVINFLLKNLPRDCKSVFDIINNVNRVALEEKHKITIPFLKKILYTQNRFEK